MIIKFKYDDTINLLGVSAEDKYLRVGQEVTINTKNIFSIQPYQKYLKQNDDLGLEFGLLINNEPIIVDIIPDNYDDNTDKLIEECSDKLYSLYNKIVEVMEKE